ncbi:MAG TPA: hypothetical protein DEB06_05400 [Phycisphaerales bacterium]|nr:hypothetical protein [Phycisphaerales bacterium]
MNSRDIEKLAKAEPFTPFEMHLVTGRVVSVPHPEFIYIPPGRGSYVVVTDDEGLAEFINVMIVVSINPIRGAKKRSGGRKAG